MDIFPPLSYFWKAFKRHIVWTTIATIPIIILIAIGLVNVKLEYQSSSTSIFDPRDSAISSTFVRYPDFDQIGSSFLALKTDSEMLDRIAAETSFIYPHFDDITKPSYQTFLAEILPSEIVPSSWLLDEQFYREMVIRNIIAESMDLLTNPSSFELYLTTKANNPKEAQLLNRLIMNIFAEHHLQQYLERITANLNTLELYQEKEKVSIDGLTELFDLYESNKETRAINLSNSQKKRLKDRERNLIAQIISKQAEQQQTLATEVQRKLALEAELGTLLTQKGPTHPEVMQKSQELRKVKSSQSYEIIKNNINRLTRDLIQLQARMKRAGIPIDTSLRLRNLTEDNQLFFNRLNQLVKEHRLEVNNIKNQLQNPEIRRRFRFSVPPSLDLGLANKKQLIMMVGIIFFLILGTAIGTTLVKELTSPFYWDKWKYQLAHKNNFVSSTVDIKNLNHVVQLDTKQMREVLSDHSGKLGRLKALQQVRSSFINHQGHAIGSFYISTLGSSKSMEDIPSFLANLASLSGTCVVIDLSHRTKGQKETQDLNDFLLGKCTWGEVKIKRSDHQPYDLVRSHEALSSCIWKNEKFGKLINALKKQYDQVIVWGLPGSFFVEHAIVSEGLDAWLEIVDLTSCPKSAIIHYANRDKHRVILITD